MERIEGFSSSEIHKLVDFGTRKMTPKELADWKKNNPKSRVTTIKDGFSKVGLTYIKEKSYEIKLGQTLDNEQYSKSTSWGHVVESFAYQRIPVEALGLSARLKSKTRKSHPKLRWSGASDFETEDMVGDIKCPFTRKSFCVQVDIYEQVRKGNIENFKINKPDYYWQLVSNAVLSNKNYGMAVCFLPTEDDVLEILSESNLEFDPNDDPHLSLCKERLKWLRLEETPYLKMNSYYDSINWVRFKIPEQDKKMLVSRVTEADAELTKTLKF